MTRPSPEDVPLFDVADTPVKVPPRTLPSGPERPRWTKYTTKSGTKCDDCMLVLAQAQGRGPASRQARWRRRVGRSDLVLCYAHALERRTGDGFDALPESG